MGLVREIVGRMMGFVLVSTIFLCGPLLGAFRWPERANEASNLPLAGEGGREVWGSLWEAAALAAEPPVVERPPVEETTGAATPAANRRIVAAAAETRGSETEVVATRPTGTPAPASGAGTPGKTKGKRCESDPVPQIAANGDGKWIVHRNIVHVYTRSLAKLDELGWSKRHFGADGKADGMQIGGVRCNSDLHRAGIRSGDIVHAVNGREVTSIPDALFVYTKVRKDDIVRVELTRKGERRTFVYRMVG